MNSLVPLLNNWSDQVLAFAWPMLWQSSLLIALLFLADLLLKRKLRPAVRYALWLVVLVKLLLPPTLALPTSIGWWLRPAKTAPASHRPVEVVVTYGPADPLPLPVAPAPIYAPPPPPKLSTQGWLFAGIVSISLSLLAWMLVRWVQVIREANRAVTAPGWLVDLLPEHARGARVRLIEHPQSPAVCGLFRPVILLPRSLTEQLSPAQLRAVLLHELFHLRRGDVWVNCLQALLQIAYWWHPLLWLANARIRRLREEAVDDAVMLALNEEFEHYAPTLLEVAKLALGRPLASLGLVGILESRSALRQRVERLVEFRPPRKAGLTIASVVAVCAFAAAALPMEQAPAPAASSPAVAEAPSTTKPATNNAGLFNALAGLQKGIDSLVHDGKLLYEMGKPAEAEQKLREALRLDPQNAAATYYLNLVKEHPNRLPGPGPGLLPAPTLKNSPNNVTTNAARGRLIKALNDIRLDQLAFDRAPLSEVIRFLSEESRKRDPQKRGITMLINQPATRSRPSESTSATATEEASRSGAFIPTNSLAALPITIDPPLKDIRLADAFEAIAKVAPEPIKWTIEDYAVVLSRRSKDARPPLLVRTFHVDPDTLIARLRNVTRTLGRTVDDGVTRALITYFANSGVDVDPEKNSGKALYYKDSQGLVVVRATEQDLAIIERLLQNLNLPPAPADGGQPTNSHPKLLEQKLKVSALVHDGELLYEMDRLEAAETKLRDALELDPQNEAALYYLKLVKEAQDKSNRGPVRRLPFRMPFDNAHAVRVSSAGQGVTNSQQAAPLQVRTFRVDTNALIRGLHIPGGPLQTNFSKAIILSLNRFFTQIGVDLDPERDPGKAFYYKDRMGWLVVRATAQELDIVGAALAEIASPGPQINIKCRFVELTQEESKALGFDWYLGNVITNAGPSVASNTRPPAAGMPWVFLDGTPMPGSDSNSSAASARQNTNTSFTLSGILTDPQYRMVIKALQQRKGAQTLAEPGIVTLSGRQATIKVAEIRTVATGIKEQALTPPGITDTDASEDAVLSTEKIECGPVFDVLPTVLADGRTINLTVTASLREFLGYDDANTNRQTVYVNGKAKQVNLPRPKFKNCKLDSTLNVKDGQTIVLGGWISEQILTLKDTIPMLADLPVLGPLFRSESKSPQRRNLLVFITPTLVDATGNRVHDETDK